MVWISRSERNWVRHQEDKVFREVAQKAEADFARFAQVLNILLDDPVAARMLSGHGLTSVWPGRSMRSACNQRTEGIAVLEHLVMVKRLEVLLADVDLVRWMSRHHAGELAALHDLCG